MSSKKEIHVLLHISCCDAVCLILHLVNPAFLILLQRDNLLGFRAIQLPTSSECLLLGKARGIPVRLFSEVQSHRIKIYAMLLEDFPGKSSLPSCFNYSLAM